MNILHLSSESTWRGGEQQIAYLLEEAEKKGIKPIIACKKDSSFEAYAKAQNWLYFSLPFKNSLDIATAWQLKKVCRKMHIDIMHLHSSISHGIAVLSNSLGNPSELVLSRRVDFPLKTNSLSQWKYNHHAIKKIICVSDKIRDVVIGKIKNQAKVVTVHSGIDLHKFKPGSHLNTLRNRYNFPASTKMIGNTSAIADQKDYFTFVDTAEVLLKENSDLKFLIIGEGPLKSQIENYISSKNLQNDVLFTGFLHNIAEVLPELDIFLITSKTEGLGTSILDAFASKIPVVATDAGGIPEIVWHERTGLLAPVQDSKALANQVKIILMDAELKGSLTKTAFSFVQQFSKEKTAEKTIKIYQEILRSG